MVFSCQRSLLSYIICDMKISKKISHILLILSFGFSILFAENDLNISHYDTDVEEVEKQVREEVISPPAFPSLIDLSERKIQKEKAPKYASLYLFIFNIAMFTAGIAVVKGITGNRV
jgi:hypothetical protein